MLINPNISIVGHRGARGFEPENTLRAVRKGIELGATWIEIDVRRVKDELFVIHDHRLERTTNGTGELAERESLELRSLDAGRGEKIPFLSEVIDEVKGKAGLHVELKGRGVAEPVAKLLKGKAGKGLEVIVSSFDHRELKNFAGLLPSVRIGALVYGYPLSLAKCATELNAYSIHVDHKFLDADFVADARSRNLKILTYTVNEREDIFNALQLGIDGIFTDFPDRVVEAVRRHLAD